MLLNIKITYFALLKVPMDGYKFPVYTTASCPKNKAEWLMRSFVLNCTDQNGYMCIPDENITVLVEFCYTKNVQAIPKGKKYGSIIKYQLKVMRENQMHSDSLITESFKSLYSYLYLLQGIA